MAHCNGLNFYSQFISGHSPGLIKRNLKKWVISDGLSLTREIVSNWKIHERDNKTRQGSRVKEHDVNNSHKKKKKVPNKDTYFVLR